MRRTLALALFFFLAAFTARAAQHGAWHLTNHDGSRDDGRVQLELSSGHNQWGHTMDAGAFTGLNTGQMSASAETPADFRLVRDAGTIHFTGSFLNGEGVGRFSFAPNASYSATLRGLGVAASDLD